MRRRSLSLGLLGVIAALGAVSGTSAAPPPAWGTAIQVPGTATLGSEAVVDSLSCPTPGYCAAGGTYRDHSGYLQSYVVDKAGGVWGNAKEVPGTAALDIGHLAVVLSVSCAAPGNCAAGGFYDDGSATEHRHVQAFVADETDGVWGTAIEVPGTSTLDSGGYARVNSISCASAGNCAAVGNYIEEVTPGAFPTFADRAFVVDEVDGTWNTAIEIPGTADVPPDAKSISCPTAGNCTAGGSYEDETGGHAFVVDETNGSWGDAIEVPGTTIPAGDATVESVSCATAGNCAAGGQYGYYDTGYHFEAFVVDETNGVWGTAITVPGTRALNVGGNARVESGPCASSGNCAAGGFYRNSSGWHTGGFVVSETHGSWRTAIAVPGKGRDAAVQSVSCATAHNCAAGGYVTNSYGRGKPFIVGETNGRWLTAVAIPGVPPRSGGGGIHSLSCATARNCVAAGSYGRWGHVHAFVVNSRSGHASVSITRREGRAGASIEVSGSKFAPGERVVVRYITGLASPKKGARVTICTAKPDAAGAFVCTGRIPVTADVGRYGRHRIVANGSTGDRASTAFWHARRRG